MGWFSLVRLLRELITELRILQEDGTFRSINARLGALDQRTKQMALDFTKIQAAVARISAEIRELAAKLTNPQDQANLDALADQLDAVTTEVDDDGSHPKV